MQYGSCCALDRALREHLAKPYDSGAEQRSALASRRQIHQGVTVFFVESALCAAQSPDIAVQTDDVLRACGMVQAVHILGDESKLRRALLELSDGEMRGVRLRRRDGVEGASRLVARGGSVIVQDEASCAVWGMPRAILEAGLACAALPPDKIARRIAARTEEQPCK